MRYPGGMPAEKPSSSDADKDNAERWSWLLITGVATGIILPFLGAVGFFDPWETHYAEVARQMVVRDDWLYPFWKEAYFFSKPILLFWTTAWGYALLGADEAGPMPAGVELVGRLPSALLGLLTIFAVYFAARRLWGRRPAVLSALVLSTTPFWALLSRQAITDLPYVATASIALLLLAVALFDDEHIPAMKSAQLPRWLLIVIALCLLPQLWEIGRTLEQLDRVTLLGSEGSTRLAVSLLLVAAGGGLLIVLQRSGRDPLLHAAALACALSTLAKGPIGVALIALALLFTIALLGEWDRVARPAVPLCILLYLAVAAPWPLAMTFFTGLDESRKTWVGRFILYDLLGRVGGGVHGDRGSFEYYVRYAGFGFFPWSAFVPVALIDAILDARDHLRTREGRFTLLAAVWAIVIFAFFSATTTKFHHYILPLAVPAALLVGRFLDRILAGPLLAPLLVAFVVLLLALIARDLTTEPWQFVDLFTYHYKGYKPEYYFPVDTLDLWHPAWLEPLGIETIRPWRLQMAVFCFLAVGVSLIGAVIDARRRSAASATSIDDISWKNDGWRSMLALVVGHAGANRGFVLGSLLAAVAFSLFIVQVHWARASQHWSQRWIFETYHQMKVGDEPIISYQMDWKGETFYGKNHEIQVKKDNADLRRLIEQPGREFVLVQTDRLNNLKTALGSAWQDHIQVVDRSNTKWLLILVEDRPTVAPSATTPAPDSVPEVPELR